MAKDGSLLFDTKIDDSGFNAGTVAMGSVLGNFATKAIEKLVGVGSAVIDLGSAFETSLAKLSTIADTDAVSIGQFSDELKDLSGATGVAAADLANVAYNAISAGASTEDAMKMVESSTKLAVAGFTDADSALSVLTTAMNAYGDSAGTVEEISGSLIAVQNLGVTTVGELSSSIGKAIATGSAYGVNLGNIESAYISMTKSGINTAESTTYLSSMMKELGDSGKDVAKIVQEKTGKSFGQLMAEGSSLADVLGIIYESTGNNAEAMMNLWGSAEAGKAANAILNQGLETFNDNLQTVTNSADATDAAYAKMADTFEMKSARLKETAKNVGITVYEGIASPLADLAQVGIDSINTLIDGFNEGGVEGLADAGLSLMEDLAESISEALPIVVEKSIDIITDLGNGLIENAPMLIERAGGIVLTLLKGIGEAAPMLILGAGDLIISLVTGLIKNLPKIIESAVSIVLQIKNTLKQNYYTIISAGIELLGKLAAGIIKAVPQLLGKIPDIISGIKRAFTSINWGETGINIVKGIANGIAKGASHIISAVSNVAKNALDTFKAKLGIHSPSKKFEDESEWIPEGSARGIENKAHVVTDAIDDMSNDMMSRLDADAMVSRMNGAFDSIQSSAYNRSSTGCNDISGRSNESNLYRKIEELLEEIEEQRRQIKKLSERPIVVENILDGEKIGKISYTQVTKEQKKESSLQKLINGEL